MAVPKKPKLAKLLTTLITDPVSVTAATTPPKPASKPRRTTKEAYTIKKIIKTLREITSRAGQGPIDYKEFTTGIKVTINLIDLLQMSPDYAKALRTYSTRINNNKKRTTTHEFIINITNVILDKSNSIA
jgi:hypothetical protein